MTTQINDVSSAIRAIEVNTRGIADYLPGGGTILVSANGTISPTTYVGWNAGTAITYTALRMEANTAGLDFYLYKDARVAIWDNATFGSGPPANPADTGSFAWAVYGDAIFGDYNTWTRSSGTIEAGLQIGRRIGTAMVDITKTTNIYSHIRLNVDADGGANITLVPNKADDASVINSGVLKLTAYGQGTGADANQIIFYARSAVNTAAEVGRIGPLGLTVNAKLIAAKSGSNVNLQNITGLYMNGVIDHDGATAGFYGTAPTAQQLLATGAGATVDNVITALQNLGLVKQS